MKKKVLFGVLLLAALVLGGCSEGTGTIIVETNPSEAEVHFQGRLMGETPLELSGLAPCSGILTLRKDGYEAKDVAVSIIAGKVVSVVEQLEKDQVRITKPDELVRQLWIAVGNNDMALAEELWHPAIPKQNVTMALNTMRKTMEDGRNPELLAAFFVSFDLYVSPMGYDRYVVTPMAKNEVLDDSLRYMVQRFGDSYILLLPGFAFDSAGIIKPLGIEFFGAHNRPDPNLSFQSLLLAMARGDEKSVREHTSKHTTPEVIEFLASASGEVDSSDVAESDLIAAFMRMTYPVFYIDPQTVIIGEKPGDRRLMVWEDDMWKSLPHEISHKVFSDTELPPFFER